MKKGRESLEKQIRQLQGKLQKKENEHHKECQELRHEINWRIAEKVTNDIILKDFKESHAAQTKHIYNLTEILLRITKH